MSVVEQTARAIWLVDRLRADLLARTAAHHDFDEQTAAWVWSRYGAEMFAIVTSTTAAMTTQHLREGFLVLRRN